MYFSRGRGLPCRGRCRNKMRKEEQRSGSRLRLCHFFPRAVLPTIKCVICIMEEGERKKGGNIQRRNFSPVLATICTRKSIFPVIMENGCLNCRQSHCAWFLIIFPPSVGLSNRIDYSLLAFYLSRSSHSPKTNNVHQVTTCIQKYV
jgi:hypothetical protein